MKRIFYILPLFMSALLTACDADYMPEQKEQMMVEGWIDDGGFPVVMLSRSLVLSGAQQDVDTLSNYLIRWARVSVSDGERTVLLTGKFDSRYFPPYIYTTGHMRGMAGRTYTLDVEYKEFHATAVTTIPESHAITSLSVEPAAKSDTLYQVSVGIDTERARGSYYQLFTCVGRRNRLFSASYLGTLNGSLLRPGAQIPVYRAHRMATGTNYTPYFTAHDTIAVKLAHVDAESYAFWSDYSRNLSLANNLFMAPTSNMRSNVHGATGYWCGMGADVRYVVIGDEIKK